MDDKTEHLRDIFMDVSEEETVTETQAETRGSLAADEGDDREQLRDVVATMRDRESFATDFETGTYVRIVRAFYDDEDDDAIAAALEPNDDDLEATAGEVFRARMDLHLLRGNELDAVDACEVRDRREEDDAAIADALDVDAATVRRARRVVDAEDAARAANHRYRTQFEEILTDAALSGAYAGGVREDGLDEAAEDIETDVSF
jgi:hypothetical protein